MEDGGIRDEYDVQLKYTLHMEEKKRIAKMAALMIRDSDFVYLDASAPLPNVWWII